MARAKTEPKLELSYDEKVASAVGLYPNASITPVFEELVKLRDLIKWVAPRIERMNGSGIGVSEKWCLLCAQGKPEFKRQPCRHTEIWAIAKEGKES